MILHKQQFQLLIWQGIEKATILLQATISTFLFGKELKANKKGAATVESYPERKETEKKTVPWLIIGHPRLITEQPLGFHQVRILSA
jgi:hypothetical protein